MTRKETYKRHLVLKELLQEHKGLENAIKTNEICNEMAKNGYSVKRRFLPAIMQKMRNEYNLPICYQRGKGYFWANGKQDILTTIEDLQSQICTLQATIELMKGFILE